MTHDNLLASNTRLLLINLNSNLTNLSYQIENETTILKQEINSILDKNSKNQGYKFSKNNANNYTLGNLPTKDLQSILQAQNKTLMPIGQNFVSSFEHIEFPLFKISLNLEQIITIFPIAVLIGFMICAFQLVEIIHFKSYIEDTYNGDAKTYIDKRSPSWINIDSRSHRYR